MRARRGQAVLRPRADLETASRTYLRFKRLSKSDRTKSLAMR